MADSHVYGAVGRASCSEAAALVGGGEPEEVDGIARESGDRRSDRAWGGVMLAVVASTLALLGLMARGVSDSSVPTAAAEMSAMHEEGLVKDRNVVASPLSSGVSHAPAVEGLAQEDSETIEVPHEHIDWEALAAGVKVGEVFVDETSGEYETMIYQSDFWNFPRVKEWLNSMDLWEDTEEAVLSNYIPVKVKVRGKPMLIMGGGKLGAFGADVMDGLTCFAMQYQNATGTSSYEGPTVYSASYTVVIDMMGHVRSISPTMYDLDDERYHFIALKPYPLDPAYLMGGIDIEETQKGPPYLWRWDIDEDESAVKRFVELGGGSLGDIDCHDLNVAVEEDALWFTFDDSGFCKRSLSTGDMLYNWTVDSGEGPEGAFKLVEDPNHVQMVEQDQFAILSSRITNAFLKIRVETKTIDWIVGGKNGTVTIFDEEGNKHLPHSDYAHDLFWGQHNVEYMGDDKYYLFDDGSYLNDDATTLHHKNASSLMILQIMERDAEPFTTAHVIWKYDIGMYTSFYGDHDRVLTGNSLGAFWDSERSSKHVKAEAFVREVTPKKETAWEVAIYGNNSGTKEDGDHGWMIYSAERFYTAPIISAVKCAEDSGGKIKSLKFTVHNNFRQSNIYKGSWKLVDGDVTLKENSDFGFATYWQGKDVQLEGKGLGNAIYHSCDVVTIQVTNQFGQTTSKSIEETLR